MSGENHSPMLGGVEHAEPSGTMDPVLPGSIVPDTHGFSRFTINRRQAKAVSMALSTAPSEVRRCIWLSADGADSRLYHRDGAIEAVRLLRLYGDATKGKSANRHQCSRARQAAGRIASVLIREMPGARGRL